MSVSVLLRALVTRRARSTTAASLVFYATTVSSVHQLGEGSHFFFRGPAARRAAEEARIAANK